MEARGPGLATRQRGVGSERLQVQSQLQPQCPGPGRPAGGGREDAAGEPGPVRFLPERGSRLRAHVLQQQPAGVPFAVHLRLCGALPSARLQELSAQPARMRDQGHVELRSGPWAGGSQRFLAGAGAHIPVRRSSAARLGRSRHSELPRAGLLAGLHRLRLLGLCPPFAVWDQLRLVF